MAVIGGNTESHIVNLINQCGFGEPVLLQNGNPIQLSGNKLTSNGAFTAGVAYLDTGNCGTLSNDCIVVEMTLQNSGISAADISLISPHEFNVPVRFEFADGNCTGQGQTCSNESCNNALHDPTDVQGTVICQEENVGLDITFCPGNSTTTTSSSSSTATSSSTGTSTQPQSNPLPSNTSDSNQTGKQSNTAVIAGSVVGAVLGLALLLLVGFLCFRRRKRQQNAENTKAQAAHHADIEPMALQIEPFDLKPEIAGISTASVSVPERHPDQKTPQKSSTTTRLSPHSPDTTDPSSFPLMQSSSSTHPITRSGTIRTERQMQLQSQADGLRDQISQLGSASGTSDVGVQDMQVTVDRLVARIRTLEDQLNSDWAMGLSNDPPPTYTAT